MLHSNFALVVKLYWFVPAQPISSPAMYGVEYNKFIIHPIEMTVYTLIDLLSSKERIVNFKKCDPPRCTLSFPSLFICLVVGKKSTNCSLFLFLPVRLEKEIAVDSSPPFEQVVFEESPSLTKSKSDARGLISITIWNKVEKFLSELSA